MRSFTHHFSSLIGLRAILPAKPAPPPSILALGARRRLSKSRADSAIRAGIDRTPLGSVGWTGGPVGSRPATASRPLIGAAGLLGRGAAKQTVNEWLPTARPVPAKDDSAFAVEVIMRSRRGEGPRSGVQDGHCVI